MRLTLPVTLILACGAVAVGPGFARAGPEPRKPSPATERDQSAQRSFAVSCRTGSDGRIVPTRHEPKDIYDGVSFAGRSHQAPTYEDRGYRWGGRIPITDTLYTQYRQLRPFLGRQAFTRIGSTDGVVYVYVQSLGCLFDRYVPHARPAVAR